MQAVDFNSGTLSWDNRITPGAVSVTRGDFVATGAASTYPTYQVVNNVPAVVFTGSFSAQYMTASASLPLYAGLYGNSDWTYEAWLYSYGVYNTVVESTTSPQVPVFQWGLRATTTCGSAHFGIGDSATDGAGGHYSCDLTFGSSPSTYKPSTASGIGYTPTINTWHHIVVTYPGGAAGNETIFVDGLAVSFAVHNLAINVPVNMYLGAWYTASSSTYYGGQFAIGALRMHDHALTPAQIVTNYNADYLWYNPSATPTATPTNSATPSSSSTSSASNTPSTSNSISSGATQSSSLSMTPSLTVSPTITNTPSPTASASVSASVVFRLATASLLIDMQAVDFNAGAQSWDNRITPGAGERGHRFFVGPGGICLIRLPRLSNYASFPSNLSACLV